VAIRSVAPTCKSGSLACQLEAVQTAKGTSTTTVPALSD
jgi:hypothetical protein